MVAQIRLGRKTAICTERKRAAVKIAGHGGLGRHELMQKRKRTR